MGRGQERIVDVLRVEPTGVLMGRGLRWGEPLCFGSCGLAGT